MSLAQVSPPHERGRNLREPLRLPAVAGSLRPCAILSAPSLSSRRTPVPRPRLPAVAGPPAVAAAPIRSDHRRLHLQHLSQIPELLRSVDSGELMRHLSPFRINTSEFPRSVDSGGLMRHLTPFKINTSKKGGGGVRYRPGGSLTL